MKKCTQKRITGTQGLGRLLGYTIWAIIVVVLSIIGPLDIVGVVASPVLVTASLVMLFVERLRLVGLLGLVGWIPSLIVLAGLGQTTVFDLDGISNDFLRQVDENGLFHY